MRLVRDLDHRNLCPGGSVVTVGNFDGLHRGHAALLASVEAAAHGSGLAEAVVSFEPLAREYFAGDQAPARIYSASERLRILRQFEPDVVWLCRFNAALVNMSAETFVRRILVDGLNARHVIVGSDFRFGRGREGDTGVLEKLGERFGFTVGIAPTVTRDGARVSSTAVREALANSDFELAEELLGRPYTIYGRVVRGSRLGHRLGYPTANIKLRRRRPPVHGIFAVIVDGPDFEGRRGVASLGCRPTVAKTGETLLEVHLFDFEGNLYGAHLDVRFVAKLREEERFENVESMIKQMDRDAARARALLAA
ncbi:MAG: bifunctional riboflavin kinase/FAD synthetase [Xanthomonadales bacterium]|nr:bifunctional riboflavin kinase/FAD synthetase [Xanthomonadales bacterium]